MVGTPAPSHTYFTCNSIAVSKGITALTCSSIFGRFSVRMALTRSRLYFSFQLSIRVVGSIGIEITSFA